ncbi:MAG: OmpH family outer membrane protein [Pikeienuella sp.]
MGGQPIIVRFAQILIALALLTGQAHIAQAQQQQKILVVDRQKVLTDSNPARQLRELEIKRRTALRQALDRVQKELEVEEAEITALRGELARAAFQERVKTFDQKVRQARTAAQQQGEKIQSEFAVARGQLADALSPILQQISEREGADLIIDVTSVLIARAGVDVTNHAIELMNQATIEFSIDQPGELSTEEE